MKIKVASLYSLQALLISIAVALLYLHMIALPVLRGQSKVYAFIAGDAMLYMDPVYSHNYLRDIGRGIFVVNKFNVFGMCFLGKTALWISPQNPEYVVFCFNILVLAATIRNFQHILLFYRSNKYHLFLPLFLLNPIVLMSTVALNKEIWGLFFVSSFLKHRLHGQYVHYFIVAVISFFIRDIYAVIGVLFLLMSTVKLNKVFYLVLISVLLPAILPKSMTELLIQGQDESSLGLTLLLDKIQALPLGYVLTYLPKLVMSMFSSLSPIRFFDVAIWNWVAVYTRVSCLLFLVLTCIVLHKYFCLKRGFDRQMVNLFFAYTLVACVVPFVHHRYIFPVYPVLILIALLSFHRMPVRRRRPVATEVSDPGS